MSPIGIALIGSGNFIRDQHVPAVESSAILEIKAIYSRSKASAVAVIEDKLQDEHIYSEDQGAGRGYEDLLARKDIVAVLIALPITVQPEFIKKALTAGKHVLSEKPIAKDIATARDLVSFYNSTIDASKVSWGVAENFRFLDSLQHASSIISNGKLGKISTFHSHLFANVGAGNASFETAWRKKPDYQGGFLLDGGVHFVAATRVMLGGDEVVRLSAFTKLVRDHLPPVDTVDAIMRTKNGVQGTFSVSFGSSNSGSEYTITGEKGFVSVVRGGLLKTAKEQGKTGAYVVVKLLDGEESTKDFPDDGTGVQEEVAAWAKSLADGKVNLIQAPGQALKDLEIIEKMLLSGEKDGETMTIG